MFSPDPKSNPPPYRPARREQPSLRVRVSGLGPGASAEARGYEEGAGGRAFSQRGCAHARQQGVAPGRVRVCMVVIVV